MWPFNKPEIRVERRKSIDITKFETLEQLTYFLSKVNLFRNAAVDEEFWDDPMLKNALGDKIIEVTYKDGLWDSEKEYDPSKD